MAGDGTTSSDEDAEGRAGEEAGWGWVMEIMCL